MKKRTCISLLLLLCFAQFARGQKAEVTVGLNEAFFSALLDAIYENYDPPQFSLAKSGGRADSPPASYSFAAHHACNEQVTILRELNGVRTAIRIRDGKITVPLAFTGSYDPPLVGCVSFSGTAEGTLDLSFDQDGQRLVGRIKVSSVNLTGTGGVGGSVVALLLQGTIDKKLNPIEVIRLDKLSFIAPIQNAGTIKMRAIALKPEVTGGLLNLRVTFEMSKG